VAVLVARLDTAKRIFERLRGEHGPDGVFKALME
jgi:hypothetical protein